MSLSDFFLKFGSPQTSFVAGIYTSSQYGGRLPRTTVAALAGSGAFSIFHCLPSRLQMSICQPAAFQGLVWLSSSHSEHPNMLAPAQGSCPTARRRRSHTSCTHTQPCALRTFTPVTMKITPPHMSLPHMLPLYLTPHTTPTACLHTAYAHTQLPQLAHSIYHTQRPQLAHSLCPHTLTLHTLHAFTTVPSAYAIQITFHTEVTAQRLCFTGMSTERCSRGATINFPMGTQPIPPFASHSDASKQEATGCNVHMEMRVSQTGSYPGQC